MGRWAGQARCQGNRDFARVHLFPACRASAARVDGRRRICVSCAGHLHVPVLACHLCGSNGHGLFGCHLCLHGFSMTCVSHSVGHVGLPASFPCAGTRGAIGTAVYPGTILKVMHHLGGQPHTLTSPALLTCAGGRTSWWVLPTTLSGKRNLGVQSTSS